MLGSRERIDAAMPQPNARMIGQRTMVLIVQIAKNQAAFEDRTRRGLAQVSNVRIGCAITHHIPRNWFISENRNQGVGACLGR
jgi:hypothetical protein